MGTDDKGGDREVVEREQYRARSGAARGPLGRLATSVVGLAAIGLLIAFAAAVGKPVVEKQIGLADLINALMPE